MKLTKTEYKTLYLDYFNNFLTIRYFAEHYGFSHHQAVKIIEKGRELCL